MVKYEEILGVKVDSDVIEETFELGEKMISKHTDLSEFLDWDVDEFTDMKKMYSLATSFKEQMITSIKQQNLQTEMIYDLTEIVKDLREEVSILRDELDNLKSKAKNND